MSDFFPVMAKFISAYLTAFVVSGIIPLLHIPIMRIRGRPNEALLWMFICFAVSAASFRWCLNNISPGKPDFEELAAGYFLLGFLYLGYMEIMFKLYRGFSYTILSDVLRMEPASSTQLMADFAEGTGKDEMFLRRIKTLEQGGFITSVNEVLELKLKGRILSKITSSYKNLLNLGKGG